MSAQCYDAEMALPAKSDGLFGALPVLSLLFLLIGAMVLSGCGPSDPVERIRVLQQEGQIEETIEPLQRMIDQGRRDPEVMFLYGVALANRREVTRASWPLRRAMEDPDWYEPAATRLAELAIRATDWDMATVLLDEMLERDPDSVKAHLLRAYARAQSRQDYEGTLADVSEVLDREPLNSDALVLRAVAMLGLGKVDEAGEAIEAVANHYEEVGLGLASSSRFCVVRATFAKEKGSFDLAESTFEECLEEFPSDFVVVDESVEFFDARGRFDRSLEIVRTAFEAAPQSPSYRLSLAHRLVMTGEVEEAEALMREATENSDPALSAEAYADLARFYFQRGQVDSAIDAFQDALERVPDPGAEFMFAYADVLVAAARYEEALRLAEQMHLDSHRYLIQGRVALEQGDPKKALEALSAGHVLWADNAVSRYFAALAAEQLGDFDRAIEEYRYSVRADAGSTEARMALARLYVAGAQVEEALQVIRHEADFMPPSDPIRYVLFELEILGRLGRVETFPERVRKVIRPPEVWPDAVAAVANGLRIGFGPAVAIEFVDRADRLNLADPANSVALASLMEAWIELGRGDEARQRVEKMLESHPDQTQLYRLHALILERTDAEDDLVIAAWRRASDADPENAAAWTGLGRSLAQRGQGAEGESALGRAVELDEEGSAALLALADLYRGSGRMAESERALQRAIERNPFDGVAGALLAELMIERGVDRDSAHLAIELDRADRFGATDRAQLLRARLSSP